MKWSQSSVLRAAFPNWTVKIGMCWKPRKRLLDMVPDFVHRTLDNSLMKKRIFKPCETVSGMSLISRYAKLTMWSFIKGQRSLPAASNDQSHLEQFGASYPTRMTEGA